MVMSPEVVSVVKLCRAIYSLWLGLPAIPFFLFFKTLLDSNNFFDQVNFTLEQGLFFNFLYSNSTCVLKKVIQFLINLKF